MWVCNRDVRLIVIATKIDSQEAYGDLKLGLREKGIFVRLSVYFDFKLIESYMPVLTYYKQAVMEDWNIPDLMLESKMENSLAYLPE